MPRHTLTTLLTSALVGFCSFTYAELKLPSVFSDNLVLQSDKDIPVWGWAKAGDKVTVSVFDQSGKKIESEDTTTGEDNKWFVELDDLDPGTKGSMVVSVSGGEEITINNVVVGEVWLASGQSNMEWPLSRSNDPKESAKKMTYPDIRFFKTPRVAVDTPQEDIKAEWIVLSPETAPGLSAVAQYFAVRLHLELNRPIGILQSAWSGTQAEPWMPADGYAKFSGAEKRLAAVAKQFENALPKLPAYETAYAEWQEKYPTAELRRANRENMPRDPRPAPRSIPSYLYNGMIHPLVPYAIEGVIWYQGEGNAGRAKEYHEVFPLLIESWRDAWDDDDLAFYYVELASFRDAQSDPVEDGWAFIREAQHAALRLDDTGFATALDVGEANDIHPKNKKTVGERLAKAVLGKVYDIGEKPYQSPTFKSHKISKGKVILSFENTGGTLKTNDNKPPRPFAIKGEDGEWKWAETKIEGDKIVAWHPEIKNPVAVRYAWANNPAINVYNAADLPLVTFRTDSEETE